MMSLEEFEISINILDQTYPYHPMGDVTEREPYKVLICCLLSVRSRDVVTMPACARLFLVADTPEKMLALPRETIAELIQPVQFYWSKVDIIRNASQELLDRFEGKVPNDIALLDSIKGVGRKTANLVLQLGFNEPAICVDTHVHRICNRLGYLSTKTADATELVLRETLPEAYWNRINRAMVRHGQEICTAYSPACDICPVNQHCQKVNVTPRKKTTPQKAVHEVFRPRTRH